MDPLRMCRRRQLWTRSCLLWHLRTLQQSFPRPHGQCHQVRAAGGTGRSRRGALPPVGLLANAPRLCRRPGGGWGGVVLVVLVISARGTGPDGPNSRSTRSPNICCPASVPVLSAMGPIHV